MAPRPGFGARVFEVGERRRCGRLEDGEAAEKWEREGTTEFIAV